MSLDWTAKAKEDDVDLHSQLGLFFSSACSRISWPSCAISIPGCLLDWMTGLLLLSAIRSKHSRWGINWALNKRPYPLPTHSHAPPSSVQVMKCFEGEKDCCDRCDEVDLKYTRDAFKTEIFIQNINHTRFHPVQLNTNNQPISCIIYKIYPRTQEAGSQPVR